jgi:hypothetical protein
VVTDPMVVINEMENLSDPSPFIRGDIIGKSYIVNSLNINMYSPFTNDTLPTPTKKYVEDGSKGRDKKVYKHTFSIMTLIWIIFGKK